MFGFVVKRCLSAIPLLFLVTFFTFALIKAVPGDPVDVLLGGSEKDMTKQQVAAIRHEMGLDKSMPEQYLCWLSGWSGQGELGRSYRDGRPVLQVIGERLPATILLVGTALVIAFGLGTGWGLLMAFWSSQRSTHALSGVMAAVALFLYSAPSFWLAFFAIMVLVRFVPGFPVLGLHWPGDEGASGAAGLHVILPALLLSSRRSAKIALFVRMLALEELSADYVLVALSKGLSQVAVLVRHVLRNSLLPIISLLGLSLPSLFGGSVLIETVFGWPGTGRLLIDTTFGRDYPVLLSLVAVYGALVIVSNLAADIFCSFADPRLQENGHSDVSLMSEAA